MTDEIETLTKSDDSCRRVMTVPGIGPLISSAIGNGTAVAKGRGIIRLGLASCPDRCRPGPNYPRAPLQARQRLLAHALHASSAGHSVATGELAEAQFRRLASSLPLNACILTFWLRPSPTSWHGSSGPCWRKSAAMRRASQRQQTEMNTLRFTKGLAAIDVAGRQIRFGGALNLLS